MFGKRNNMESVFELHEEGGGEAYLTSRNE